VRRRTAALLTAAGLAFGAALGGAVEPLSLWTRGPGEDWPRFLGPRLDSRSSEPIRIDWPADGPPLLWARPVADGYSMPSLSHGRLFHFDRLGDRDRLTAYRAETGDPLWRSEYPTAYEDYYGYSTGPRASPLVDGDRVYTLGVEGRLRCHRVTDGKLLWEVDTTERFGVVQNFFGAGASPVIEGRLLIAQIGGSPPGSPRIHSGRVRGNGSGIVAFDKTTGEVAYRLTDELASYSGLVTATIGSRRWAFAFTRGGLVGFEPAGGTVDLFFPWRSRVLESVNASTPVVVDDTVFISETYGPGSALLKVRPGGYEVVWQDPPGRSKSLATHWSTPVFDRGTLYASHGRNSGDSELRAIEHATGRVLWREAGLGRATLTWAAGHLLVLGERGELRLIAASPEGYREVARVDLTARRYRAPDGSERPLAAFPAWNAPVVSHGILYLLSHGTLAAFDVAPLSRPPTAR